MAAFTVKDIYAASYRLNGRVHETPILRNKTIDAMTGREIHFKAENLQKTGSFKCRGALNAISMLDPAVSYVCCYSSGNHGQGSAWAAKQNDKVCHVAVPHDTPEVKLDAIKNYGGVVHFSPPNDAHGRCKFETCAQLVTEFKWEMIHTTQDPRVIAGQGTVALEMLSQVQGKLDVIVLPVGGGGLISGCSTVIKAICPGVKIVGAKPAAINDRKVDQFYQKKPKMSKDEYTICDGTRDVIGVNTWPIINNNVDDILTVSDVEVAKAWFTIMERMKTVVEPTGALAFAVAMSKDFERLYPAKTFPRVGVIICGGNLDIAVVPKMIQLAKSEERKQKNPLKETLIKRDSTGK